MASRFAPIRRRKSSKKRPSRSKSRSKKCRGGMTIRYILCGVGIGVAIDNFFTDPEHLDLGLDFSPGDVPHSASRKDSQTQKGGQTINELVATPLNNRWSCTWFPNDHAKCDELLHRRLPPAIPIHNNEESASAGNQRWLFFGDSTMKRLFDQSDLKQVLVKDPSEFESAACIGQLSCKEQQAERCELNANFGLPYAPKWIPPDPARFEGPKKYGASNPFCTDCSGCQAHFLECQPSLRSKGADKCERSRRLYGGYLTMEFARDTEIQTPQFQTTQENLAAYISRAWNSPQLLQDWGKPVCVLGVGNHDVLLEGITTEDFVRNVRFMLMTMMPVCSHLVWLGNTTNGRESEYPQTMKQMKVWDRAVKELVESEPDLLRMSSYVDVLDASITFPHADYIHMDATWYHELGRWFISFM